MKTTGTSDVFDGLSTLNLPRTDLEALKKEILLSPAKDTFSFSRDELISLILSAGAAPKGYVLVNRGAIQIALNMHAAAGRIVRGELADELEASMFRPETAAGERVGNTDGKGMQAQVIARMISDAIRADALGEGHDVECGIFGPELSNVVRELAQATLAAPVQSGD